MPNKPDKFGVKFWIACDIDTKYIVNGFPYLRKRQDFKKRSEDSTFRKHRFASNRWNSGRNITMDNFFTNL